MGKHGCVGDMGSSLFSCADECCSSDGESGCLTDLFWNESCDIFHARPNQKKNIYTAGFSEHLCKALDTFRPI